jgi:hypothetical protein
MRKTKTISNYIQNKYFEVRAILAVPAIVVVSGKSATINMLSLDNR